MHKKTDAERIALYEAAVKRAEDNYPFPPLPDGEEWTPEFQEAAKSCEKMLVQQYKDCYKLQVTDEVEQEYNNALMVFSFAVQYEKVRLVRAYHRLLKGDHKASIVEGAVKILAEVSPEMEPTVKHLEAYDFIHRIAERWQQEHAGTQNTYSSEYREAENLKNEMIYFYTVAVFEDVDDLPREEILMSLMNRGVQSFGQIRAAIEEFDNIESVLLDGAL